MLNVMRVMQEMDLSVEAVDALTGSAVGWPNTGTFRLGDLVGLDVVRRNIERLRGRVDISSKQGQGTTFRISLQIGRASCRERGLRLV